MEGGIGGEEGGKIVCKIKKLLNKIKLKKKRFPNTLNDYIVFHHQCTIFHLILILDICSEMDTLRKKNECLCLTYFSLWIILKDVFEDVRLLVTEYEHFYEILFFKRQARLPSPRQCSTVPGSRRAGIWCYHSAFSGQVELLWRQLSLLISTPLVMVELNALPEPLCVFCLVGIIFLWEAQCWWFVYFTYFHRFLNNLVRWTLWLYYTHCICCFIFIFEFICVCCVCCACGCAGMIIWVCEEKLEAGTKNLP